MSKYTVQSLESKRIVAGALVASTLFYVGDAEGKLVGKKGFDTEAEAQAELDGLGHYLTGLEFAKAQFPKDGEKAHVAKANIVARFLSWEAAGRPVIEADAPAEEGTDAEPEQADDAETF